MDDRFKSVEAAAEKAASYINVKPRTEFQTIKYLKDKGFEQEIIDEVVKELKEYRYIDDFEYSLMYFRYGFEKRRGTERIKRELAEKGVSNEIINLAFEESEDVPDQLEAATEIASGMMDGINTEELSYDAKRKLQAKIGRRLMAMGYSSDVIYKVINRLL